MPQPPKHSPKWLSNLSRFQVACFVLLLGMSITLVVTSCSTASRSVVEFPQVEGAHFVGNNVCSECHTNYTRVFEMSPHARAHFRDAEVTNDIIGCESC